MQEKIKYKDVIDLGFKEEFCNDDVYYNQYGFEYVIITFELTKKIYIDWAKETQLCEMVRIDNTRECNIKSTMPIKNLDHLKEIIDFFTDK